jgi:hypothetical protein
MLRQADPRPQLQVPVKDLGSGDGRNLPQKPARSTRCPSGGKGRLEVLLRFTEITEPQ